jgi:hypothetical protein
MACLGIRREVGDSTLISDDMPRGAAWAFALTAGIEDAIDLSAGVVRDEEAAVGAGEDVGGTAPFLAAGEQPAGGKALHRAGGLAVREVDAYHFVTGRHAAKDRAVQRDEQIALVLGREARNVVERESQCGGMRLWQSEERAELVTYLWQHELLDSDPFWKLAQALFEVLPRTTDDWKLVSVLLGEREGFKSQAKEQQGKLL